MNTIEILNQLKLKRILQYVDTSCEPLEHQIKALSSAGCYSRYRENDAWKVDHAMTHLSAVSSYDTVSHKLEDMVIPSLQFLWPPLTPMCAQYEPQKGQPDIIYII